MNFLTAACGHIYDFFRNNCCGAREEKQNLSPLEYDKEKKQNPTSEPKLYILPETITFERVPLFHRTENNDEMSYCTSRIEQQEEVPAGYGHDGAVSAEYEPAIIHAEMCLTALRDEFHDYSDRSPITVTDSES